MTKQKKTTKRRSIILSCFLATVIIVLLLLPYGIRHGILYALQEQGVESARIDDVDFNLFTGTLAIEDLILTEDGETSLGTSTILVDFSWLQLFKKRFYVEELSIDECDLNVRQLKEAGWSLGGIPLPAEEKPADDKSSAEKAEPMSWGFGIGKLTINKSRVGLMTADLIAELDIQAMNFVKARSWAPDSPSVFEFRGKFNDGSLNIKTDLQPFSENPGVKGKLSLNKLSLHHFSAFLPPEIESLKGELSVTSDLDVVMSEGSGLTLSHKGVISISDTEVKKRPFQIGNRIVEWNGGFSFSEKGEDKGIRMDGDIFLENLAVNDLDNKISILHLDRLDVEKIRLESLDDANVSLVKMGRLEIAKPVDPGTYTERELRTVFETAGISISDIELTNMSNLIIKDILFQGTDVAVLRRADEKLHIIYEITELLMGDAAVDTIKGEPSVDEVTTEDKTVEAEDGFKFRIDEFRISKDSNILFDDESIEPPFRTHIVLNNISLQNINSIDPEKNMNLDADAKMGEYSTIKFGGTIQPFVEKMNSNITGEVKELDLSQFSPYAIKALGYNVVSGQLNAGIDFKVVSDEIQGDNALELKKLKIAPTDEDKVESLASKLSISLDLTLDVLRDKNGDVRINLPVSGDISDPKFDFQDIINKALLFATKQTAFSFLKNAFQPYGTLITVIDIAGKATRIKLDPAFFDAGSKDTEKSSEYLDQVVKLMNERPGIQISICGIAVSADRAELAKLSAVSGEGASQESAKETTVKADDAIDQSLPEVSQETLMNLAKERAAIIKKELVEKHGIEAGRLFICNPEIDEEEEAKPRAELLI